MEMEKKQQIQEALDELVNKKKEEEIDSLLEEYLSRIAKTGVTEFPWIQLKPLVSRKMDTMVEDFHAKQPTKQGTVCPNVESVAFEDMKKRLHSYLDIFNGVPFTIQRLCELLCSKKVFAQYKNADKYMRGLEKNLMIVTTVDPFGRRVVNEPKVMNGGVHEGVKSEAVKEEGGKEDTPRKSTSSWFSCLSDVVESPNSYPTWNHSSKPDLPSPLSSQLKRLGNGDLKDPESNVIFSSKFRSLSTDADDDDHEASQPVSKVPKLDEAGMEEEESRKSATDRPQSTPLLSELLNNSTATQAPTNPPLTAVSAVFPDSKKSQTAEKKGSSPERKSPILAVSTHQSEGVPTNVVHPLQKHEVPEEMEECVKSFEEKEESCDEMKEFSKEETCSNEVPPIKEVVDAIPEVAVKNEEDQPTEVSTLAELKPEKGEEIERESLVQVDETSKIEEKVEEEKEESGEKVEVIKLTEPPLTVAD